MSPEVCREILRFVLTKTDDPEMKASQIRLVKGLVDLTPGVRDELVQEVLLADARARLCRVLAVRKLVPSPEDEARIGACIDLPTLKRWHEQAVDAPSVADALR